MAITAMGLGTKAAPEGANLDPQREFWSWLRAFLHPHENGDNFAHQRAYFSGFACTQTDPAGMSIKIGGTATPDSAVLVVGPVGKPVLLSTNGEPELVTIPTAPATGSRIDAVVSYIDTTSPVTDSETPGTPEYVHTIVVSGTAASNPSAPTNEQIIAALPAGAGGTYYRWCDVRVAASQTVITNSDIIDRKPMAPNVYSSSILDLIYPVGSIAIGAKPSIGTWEQIQGRFLWASNQAHPAGSTGGEETHKLTVNEMPSHSHTSKLCGITSTGPGAAQEGDFYRTAHWNRFQTEGSNVHDYYGMGTLTPQSVGGGQPHNNMPPYLSVDMWRRTA